MVTPWAFILRLKSKKSAEIKSDLVKVLLKKIYLNGDTMGLLLIYELKSGKHIQSKYYQVKALLPTNKVLPSTSKPDGTM